MKKFLVVALALMLTFTTVLPVGGAFAVTRALEQGEMVDPEANQAVLQVFAQYAYQAKPFVGYRGKTAEVLVYPVKYEDDYPVVDADGNYVKDDTDDTRIAKKELGQIKHWVEKYDKYGNPVTIEEDGKEKQVYIQEQQPANYTEFTKDDLNKVYPTAATDQTGTEDRVFAIEVKEAFAPKNFGEENQDNWESMVTFSSVNLENPLQTQNKVAVVHVYNNKKAFKVKVVDEEGTPIENAKVELFENTSKIFGEQTFGEMVMQSVMTNKEGMAEITADIFRKAIIEGTDLFKSVNNSLENNNLTKYYLNGVQASAEGYYPSEVMGITKEQYKNLEKKIVLSKMNNPMYVDRVGGEDRYETAVMIADKAFPNGLAEGKVIIASGQNYADALVANGLTELYNAPVLLTKAGSLPKATAEYLDAHKEDNKGTDIEKMEVIFVGGQDVVMPHVEAQVEKMGYTSSRIAGEDRYKTAAMVLDHLVRNSALDQPVYIASGAGFPDALIASVPAACFGKPILLTKQDHISPEIQVALDKHDVNSVVFVGGESAISKAAYSELKVANKERLHGDDRQLTSMVVAKRYYGKAAKAYVVTGWEYADALAVAKLAADNNAAVFLTKPGMIHEDVLKYIKDSKITSVTVIGGENAVSDSVRNKLNEIVVNKTEGRY